MTIRSLLLVLLSVPSFGMGCNAPDLPAPIAKAIEHEYPGWARVALSNLDDYQQKLWIAKTHDCPGVVVGHFVAVAQRSYAFALVKKDGNTLLRAGVVYWVGSDDTVHSKVLVPAAKAPNVAVVWRLHEKRSDPLDEIVWEVIEVGSSAYFWRDGRFNSRALSY